MKYVYLIALSIFSFQSFSQDTIVEPEIYPTYPNLLKVHEPFLAQAQQNEMKRWDSFQFYLFNRWGEIIAESKKVDFKVEDVLKFNESKLKEDVYIWKIELKMDTGKKHEYKGHATYLGHVH